MDLIGQQIDQYRIDALLGEGGMGAVYQATDLNLKRKVALKVMSKRLARRPQFQQRFVQEAQAAARLDHPSIVKVFNFGNRGDFLYLVMEFIGGASLMRYIRGRGAVELPVVLRLIAQAAEALDFAHAQGIVHRDIKPDNLLLKPLSRPERAGDPPLRLVVTDFGLAKMLEGGLETDTGTFMGTLPYMSPEQCTGRPLDGRSDIYALGIVLYQITTGQLPFEIRSPTDAIQKHLHEPPPPPASLRPELSSELERVILTAIAKDPAQRYQSGAELATALRQLAESLPGDDDDSAPTFVGPQADSNPTVMAPAAAPFTPSLAEFDSQPASGAQLLIARSGEAPRTLPLDKDSLVIGRGQKGDVVLDGEGVSREHLRLERTADGWQVVDLNSTNGTLLDGVKMLPDVVQPWKAGVPLQIGPNLLRWRAGEAPSVAAGVDRSYAATGLTPRATSAPPLEPLTLVLTPSVLVLDAGQTGEIQLALANEGSLVEHFDLHVSGLPPEWVTLSEPNIQLMPGARGFVSLRLAVPRTPEAVAQAYPLRIVVTTNANRVMASANGQLTVLPFSEVGMRLHPQHLRLGQPTTLFVRNGGNQAETLRVSGEDPADVLRFELPADTLTLDPGEEGQLPLTIVPRERPFIGTAEQRPFSINLSTPNLPEQTQSGQLRVPPRLPIWMATLLGTLGLLACLAGTAFGSGWLPLGGVSESDMTATAAAQIIAAATTPAVSPTAVVGEDPPTATPTPQPSASPTPTLEPSPEPSPTPTMTPSPTPTPDLTSGLLLYYPFDGDLRDASGNGLDGEFNQDARCRAFVTDRIGFAERALGLNENGCSASPPLDVTQVDAPFLNISTEFTYAAWVLPGIEEGSVWLMGQDGWAALAYGNRAQMTFQILIDGDEAGELSLLGLPDPEPVEQEIWVFFAATVAYDSASGQSILSLYRDGELVAETQVDGRFFNPGSGAFKIGANENSVESGIVYFNVRRGAVDEVRVYERALTAEEVAALYALE